MISFWVSPGRLLSLRAATFLAVEDPDELSEASEESTWSRNVCWEEEEEETERTEHDNCFVSASLLLYPSAITCFLLLNFSPFFPSHTLSGTGYLDEHTAIRSGELRFWRRMAWRHVGAHADALILGTVVAQDWTGRLDDSIGCREGVRVVRVLWRQDSVRLTVGWLLVAGGEGSPGNITFEDQKDPWSLPDRSGHGRIQLCQEHEQRDHHYEVSNMPSSRIAAHFRKKNIRNHWNGRIQKCHGNGLQGSISLGFFWAASGGGGGRV